MVGRLGFSLAYGRPRGLCELKFTRPLEGVALSLFGFFVALPANFADYSSTRLLEVGAVPFVIFQITHDGRSPYKTNYKNSLL